MYGCNSFTNILIFREIEGSYYKYLNKSKNYFANYDQIVTVKEMSWPCIREMTSLSLNSPIDNYVAWIGPRSSSIQTNTHLVHYLGLIPISVLKLAFLRSYLFKDGDRQLLTLDIDSKK